MRRTLAGAAASVALLASAYGSVPTAVASTGGDPAEVALQQLVDRRASALLSGDEAGFMATVDPDASTDFRDAQRASFVGAQTVPLSKYELKVSFEDSGDLSTPGLSEQYGAPVALPSTEARLRLEGYDVVDDVDGQWITYVKRGDDWYVGGDSDLHFVGLDTERQMWDLGTVITIPSEHFLVVTRPEIRARGEQISAIAEQALVDLRQVWNVEWPERMPIVLPESADELEEILQTTFDLDNFVAFVSYGSDPDDDWQATAPRMYIQDENLAGHTAAFQAETLVHELVHAAMSYQAGPFMDSWVHEGIADWVAKGRGPSFRADGSDGELPKNFQFITGGGNSIRVSYAESRSAISFMAATYGPDAPDQFWQGLGAIRVAAGDDDHQVDKVLGQIGAGGLTEFESAWAG